MTHRRYRAPRTQQQKDAITAMFFSGPRRCDRCQQEVPRDTGGYRDFNGRRIWACHKHFERTE